MRYPVCCSARNFAVVNTMNRKRFGILIFTIFCGTDLLANPVTAACSADNWKIVGLFKALSYQDRAIQLAYDNNQSIVCYEPLSTVSDTVSWKDVCGLLAGGVLALITDQPLPSAVNDIITAAQIPVLSTSLITTDTDSTIVSIAPSEEQLANALSSLIQYNEWTDVILLTWQGSGLELFMPGSSTSYGVTAVYYTDTSDTVMKSKLIKMRQSGTAVIILHHYDLDEILHIFKMATPEGLNIFPYVWILLGKTAEKLMTEISKGVIFSELPRMLGVYPVIISSDQQLSNFAITWKGYGSTKQLQSAAYLYDAFKILTDSVTMANRANSNFTQMQDSCDSLNGWQFRSIFQPILSQTITTTQRLTTQNSVYYYFSIDPYGYNKIATWTEESNEINQVSFIQWCSQQELHNLPLCHQGNSFRCNIKSPPPRAPQGSNYQYDYSRYSFDIVTLKAEPFVYVTQNDNGDEVLEGLCIDLLDKLSDKMGFQYTIRLVADGQYGGQLEDGSWTGLVGDLVNHRAEIAVAPLTITSNRENVIDFTKAYYDLGLRVLYNDNNNQFDTFKLFKFLRPFESNLWLLILASVVFVSVALAIIGRLSPYDWYQSPPDDFTLWESRFQMTIYNSIWQSLSAILQQGAETAPRSTAARILIGGWWFVCLVLGATFTANLTAILATQEDESNFASIEELVNKIPPNIPFGTLNNSQPASFFKFSPIRQYQEAFEYMSTEGLLYNSEDEALSAVLYDNVAYIFDSPIIDFISSRRGEYNPECTLLNIGEGLFFPVSYGLGLTKNSPYTDDFSLAILEIVEEGEIELLITEYFEFQRTCVSEIAMTGASATMDTEQITLESVGGLFIFLGIAIVLSLVALLIEFTYYSLDKRRTMHNLWNALKLKLPWNDECNVQPFIQQEVSISDLEANEIIRNTDTEL